MANPFSWFVNKAYDAINTSTRRRNLFVDMRQEDKLLLPLDRDRLVSNARSLRRNASIAAWSIRKHLDYVSTFTFHCNIRAGNSITDDQAHELNAEIESLMNWWSRPFNCDVSGRYNLPRLIRMIEGLRTTDGDCFVYKLSDGHIQVIEGDRVRTPTDLGDYSPDEFAADDFTHGIKVSDSLKPQQYAICDRSGIGNGFRLRTVASAQYVLPYGFYDRVDQVRGISPLSAAMNAYFDLYEASEYALAKMKLSQLFALKLSHSTADGDDATNDQPRKFEFGAGPQVIETDPGDNAEFMETHTPSTEFQSFMVHGIQAALKSLDIPFSFYDESHTNYSGARQALLQYQLSADIKRNDMRQLLNNLTVWRLSLFIADGHLVLPDGMSLDDIDFEWIGAGVPWIDPLKEVSADIMAVKGSFKSRQVICKEDGNDWYKIVDQIAEENAYLQSKGLGTDIENSTVQLAQLVTQGAEENATDAATK